MLRSKNLNIGEVSSKQPVEADSLATLAIEMQNLKRGQEKIERFLKAIQDRLDLVLHPSGRKANEVELTPKQQEVFAEIEQLPGSDPDTRVKVKNLLNALEGDSVTEELVGALQHALKVRAWGIQCNCGEAATVTWKRSSRCPQGGYMQFTHTGPSGKSVSHSGHIAIPALTLCDRPDRRRRATHHTS